MIMRLPIVLAALASFTLPASAQMVIISPEQIGQIFCIGSIGNDMAPIEAMLTPKLDELVAKAWDNNDAFVAAHPDEKSPLGEGLPWHGFTDYADGCTVGTVVIAKDKAIVPINYTFSKFPEANYTDLIKLERLELYLNWGTVWRIADLEYADDQGTLTKALEGLSKIK